MRWHDARSEPLTLGRFVDSEELFDLEFEAEICGFAEIMRILLGKSRRDVPAEAPAPPAAASSRTGAQP